MKLDYLKMLQDIDDLVSTDFCEDMELETGKFTQQEAVDMMRIIAKVYDIAHSTHCKHHGADYIKKDMLE